MRRKIVAGNWKMNNDLPQTEYLVDQLVKKMPVTDVKVMIAPPFIGLHNAFRLLNKKSIEVVAQNMHFAENGAYTGEVSAYMLKSVGVNTVILGHSERRAYFNEDDALLAKKTDTALAHKMNVIFCCGEELDDRKTSKHFSVVENQLKNALFHLPKAARNNIVIAYEPVWAIGTGETATPEQAQEMHNFIRGVLKNVYGEEIAQQTSILYGGSVKPSNAKEIFSQPDVDGGLIGGASLQADDFIAIVQSF